MAWIRDIELRRMWRCGNLGPLMFSASNSTVHSDKLSFSYSIIPSDTLSHFYFIISFVNPCVVLSGRFIF